MSSFPERRLFPLRYPWDFWKLMTFLSLACCAASALAAPPREIKFSLSGEQFKGEFDRQVKRQYRLVDVSTCYVGGQPKAAAIWEKGAELPWHAGAGYTPPDLQEKLATRTEEGFRLIHLAASTRIGMVFYDAIWQKHDRPFPEVRLELTDEEFKKTHETLSAAGHQLLRIAAFGQAGAIHFAGLWEKRDTPSREVQLRLSYRLLERELRRRAKDGFRLLQVCGYVDRRRLWHASIWEEAEGPEQEITGGLTAARLAKTLEEMTSQGYQPQQVSAYDFGGRDRYLVVWEAGDAPD